MEDIHIVELYWQRNPDAIEESHRKFGKMLKRISYNVLASHEDSDECVNDTYTKAWESMPPQKPSSLSAYLGRITRNISINCWHAQRAQKRGGAECLLSELTDCIPSSQNVEEQADANLLKDSLVKWLFALPRDDRVLFLRRYWFGDSLYSLAEECATTPNKLAGKMYRLRLSLKKALEREGISL